MRTLKHLVLLVMYVASVVSLRCQVATPEIGANPYKSYAGGAFDHIQMQNGSLLAQIPLISLPQKGALKLSYSLVANGPQYSSMGSCDAIGNCEYFYAEASPCAQDASFDNGGGGPSSVSIVMDQMLGVCAGKNTVVTSYGSDCRLTQCHDLLGWEWVSYSDGTGMPVQDWTPGGSGDGQTLDTWYSFGVVDSTKAMHPLGFDSSDYRYLRANDGSGYVLDMGASRTVDTAMLLPGAYGVPNNPYYIVDSHGVKQAWNLSGSNLWSMQDPIGNMIRWTGPTQDDPAAFDGMTDSVGRRVPTMVMDNQLNLCPVMSGQPAATSTGLWKVQDANGNTARAFRVCYANIHVRTDFYGIPDRSNPFMSCGIYWDAYGDPQNICQRYDEMDIIYTALQSVSYPNGTYWGFEYSNSVNDSTAYGDVLAIRLPTGGSIHYAYDNIPVCGNWFAESGQPLARAITSRTAYPLTGTSISRTFTYAPTDDPDTTVEADASGNEIVHKFTRDYPGTFACGAIETSTKWYEGARGNGQVKQTITTAYSSRPSPHTAEPTYRPVINRLPDSENTVRDGVTTSTKSYGYDSLYLDVQPYWHMDQTGQQTTLVRPTTTYVRLAMPRTVGDGVSVVETGRYFQDHQSYNTANLLDLPEYISVQDPDGNQYSRTEFAYDESGSPQGSYGNTTTIRKYISASGTGTAATVTTQFNTSGMPTQTTDARGNAGESGDHTTRYIYDGTGVFLSSVDLPNTGVAHTRFYQFDSTSGNLLKASDENASSSNDAAHTTVYGYDSEDRLISIAGPKSRSADTDSPLVTLCMSDSGGNGCSQGSAPFNVMITTKLSSTRTKVEKTSYDGLGRPIQKQVASDSFGADFTDTDYDSNGRLSFTSNPYRGTRGAGTYYYYDVLNRLRQQTQPDGMSMLRWTFSGNTVDVFDERNDHWKRMYDAASRLTDIYEDVDGSNAHTSYTYDAIGNLTHVLQTGSSSEESRSRSFTYDALSRLVTADNPETGVICYGQGTPCSGGYDLNGNLLKKTDLRGTSQMNYDSLNRLLSRSHTNSTEHACFLFDVGAWAIGGIRGKETAEWTQTTECAATPPPSARTMTLFTEYDALGNVRSTKRCVLASCSQGHSQTFDYDLIGSLTNYTDGVGTRAFQRDYDAVGRLASLSSGNADGSNFATLFRVSHYEPQGWSSAVLGGGSSGVANLYLTRGFDVRQRVSFSKATH